MTSDVKDLADRLHSAAIHLLRRVRVADQESGISPARLSILSVLVFAGPSTLGELAVAEQVRPPTITGLIRGLETDGHVRRHRDRADGRIQIVEVTAQGKRVFERARSARLDQVARLVTGLSGGDRGVLLRACKILHSALDRG